MTEIELFLQGEGIPQIVLVRVPDQGTVHDIIQAAQPHGLPSGGAEAVLVFVEGQDEPLDERTTLAAAGIRARGRVHVHRCRKVEVEVNFNGRDKSHRFSPSTTIAEVKVWADKEFKLTGVDATEHALQRCGTTERPSDDTHIGSLVAAGTCALCFDLIPKQRVEG